MRHIHKKYCLRKSCVVIMIIMGMICGSSYDAAGQTPSDGGNPYTPEEQVVLKVDAANWGSADLAEFAIDGQTWRPSPRKDGGGRGAAGEHEFRLEKGKQYVLTVYPLEAMDPDDGTVSLWWNIWSEDGVWIDGQTTSYSSPISDGSGNIGEYSYEITAPGEVKVLLSFDDGPHAESLSGDNYTMQVLTELATNTVQANAKAMWCVQTHVPYRGGHPNGQAVIQEQWSQGHVVAIHTGSDEDHVPHTDRVEISAYDADGDGDVDADDGKNALESDMIRAKSRIADLTGNIPKYVRPVGGNYNSDVLNVYQRQNLKMILWDIDSYDTHGLTVSQIKERLKTRLKEEIDEENYVLIVLFHELKSVTHGHVEEYMQALQEAAQEKNCQIHFPTSREEVESILDDY